VWENKLELALGALDNKLLFGEAQFANGCPGHLVTLGAGLLVLDDDSRRPDSDPDGRLAAVPLLLVRAEEVGAVVSQTLAVVDEQLLSPARVEAAARPVLLLHVVPEQGLLLVASFVENLFGNVVLQDEVVGIMQLRLQKLYFNES